MKTQHSALAPLLRSNTQGDLLALLLLRPDQEYTLTELGHEVGAVPATVHREISRLVDSGLLKDRRQGKSRLVSANTEARLYGPTRALIEATYGPRVVLESILQEMPGLRHALIFGSWAARYRGNDGAAPNDIDVLLVGDVTRRDVLRAAEEASRLTRQDVNIERVSSDAWDKKTDPFLTTILNKPLVELHLEKETA
ncbi:hypothetical protein [Arthrobacter pityocampae]|uniref:hypothetical protein n=1 Tax=Arthrobacter pityocampae TaxID=547334 RepID=UPI003736C921